MMLIAIATAAGLQLKIREKITAFNGHIQIYNYDNNNSEVSVAPVSLEQDFYPNFKSVDGVEHVQAVATKGGVIRTDETFEGIVAKGVGTDYNWRVFKDYLVDGRLPNYLGELNDEVLMSQRMANRLLLKVGDGFNSIFPKDDDWDQIPNQRNFKIVGVYDSGYEDFDELILFIDIRHIQRMNKWEKDQVGNFGVFLSDFEKIDEKTGEIYDKILDLMKEYDPARFGTAF